VRALVCHQLTGPQDLVIEEDFPAPASAPRTVRIEVSHAGVNFPDLLMTHGRYQFRPEPPFAPGLEVAGTVSEVADGVDGFSPGDRVMAVVGHGGWAAEVVAPAAMTFPAPEQLADAEVAAFPLAFGTAVHALIDRAALQPGETLLVTGASGGVGMAAIQVGRLMGARVVAVVSSEEKAELAAALGAEKVVVLDGDLRQRLREVSPDGFDVVFDPVGGDQFEVLVRSLAWKGRLLVIGFASGAIPAIPANLALLKGAAVVGVFWGSFTAREPERNRELFDRLFDWVRTRQLRPHVSMVLPLEQGAQALIAMAERRLLGKAVLQVR
jgi:NADPH:quinone reductase